jgi:DNA-binding NarL/FixJ family response regulator
MTKIKIAIADDHKDLKKALNIAFKSEKNFEIVLTAENGIDLLEQLKRVKPDIIIMDIRMPKMDGIEATDQVLELYPKIKIIAYSQYDYESNIIKMYTHGVRSFVGKEDGIDELFKAINIVADGGAYLTENAFEIIQRNLIGSQPKDFDCTLLLQLSQRELEVLWHVSQLKSMKEIAELLFISLPTVNNHEANIRHKLGIHGVNSLQQYSLNVKDKLIRSDGIIKLKK